MGITDRLEKLEQEQTERRYRAVLEGLGDNNSRLAELSKLIENPQSVEALLTPAGDERLLIIPMKNNPDSALANSLAHAISKELNKYRPKHEEFGDYRAYRLTPKKGRFPNSIEVTACGLMFNVRINKVDLSDYVSEAKGKPPIYVLKENYTPDVKKGQIFDAVLSTKDSIERHLVRPGIAVRKHFPGYGIDFEVKYNRHKVITHFASASNSPSNGALAGNYFSDNMKPYFDEHPELELGYALRFKVEAIEPMYSYRIIEIVKPKRVK